MEALTLENCCSMQTGLPVSRRDFAESGDLQLVQLKDIDAAGILHTPLELVKLARQPNAAKFIQNNDILLKGRGTNMTATLIEQAPPKTLASSAYFILRPQAHILPAFLAWYLNNKRLPVTQSLTIPLLQLSNLRHMPIHLPPRKVQQEIIDTHILIRQARRLSDQYYLKIGQLLKGIAFNQSQA